MRDLFLNLFENILGSIARKIIRKYNPRIIGVTGSVGKSSAKEAIYAIIRSSFRARASRGNFNNELGFPLAIIGDYEKTGGIIFWIGVIFRGLKILIKGDSDYPEFLILEYAADKPGDLDRLIRIAKPAISIVTNISKYPAHVGNYAGPEAVAKEKSKLVECLSEKDFAILNADDQFILKMMDRTKARTITYGLASGVDIMISDFQNVSEGLRPKGVSFKVISMGKIIPFSMENSFGRSQAYACAAAVSVASVLGLNLLEAVDALKSYKPLPGRTRLIEGKSDSFIIDDSYNASPLAALEALSVLRDLKAKRKIAVLADMNELGAFSGAAHEEVGRLAGFVCDVLVTVGEKGRLIASSAKKAGLSEGMIISLDDSAEAADIVSEMVLVGDIILVKGSQSMRMERVIKAIMKDPEKADRLLVRQYGGWSKR